MSGYPPGFGPGAKECNYVETCRCCGFSGHLAKQCRNDQRLLPGKPLMDVASTSSDSDDFLSPIQRDTIKKLKRRATDHEHNLRDNLVKKMEKRKSSSKSGSKHKSKSKSKKKKKSKKKSRKSRSGSLDNGQTRSRHVSRSRSRDERRSRSSQKSRDGRRSRSPEVTQSLSPRRQRMTSRRSRSPTKKICSAVRWNDPNCSSPSSRSSTPDANMKKVFEMYCPADSKRQREAYYGPQRRWRMLTPEPVAAAQDVPLWDDPGEEDHFSTIPQHQVDEDDDRAMVEWKKREHERKKRANIVFGETNRDNVVRRINDPVYLRKFPDAIPRIKKSPSKRSERRTPPLRDGARRRSHSPPRRRTQSPRRRSSPQPRRQITPPPVRIQRDRSPHRERAGRGDRQRQEYPTPRVPDHVTPVASRVCAVLKDIMTLASDSPAMIDPRVIRAQVEETLSSKAGQALLARSSGMQQNFNEHRVSETREHGANSRRHRVADPRDYREAEPPRKEPAMRSDVYDRLGPRADTKIRQDRTGQSNQGSGTFRDHAIPPNPAKARTAASQSRGMSFNDQRCRSIEERDYQVMGNPATSRSNQRPDTARRRSPGDRPAKRPASARSRENYEEDGEVRFVVTRHRTRLNVVN